MPHDAPLRLPEAFVAAIVAQARHDAPREACGLIAGLAGSAVRWYPLANVDPSPSRYLISPAALYAVLREIDERGWDLLAIYHSHTRSAAYPSAADIRLAFYPDSYYLIVSLLTTEPDLRAYRIVERVVRPVDLVRVAAP